MSRTRSGRYPVGPSWASSGVDVDLDSAEEVDVLAVRRGDVSQDIVIDPAPGPAHLLDGEPVILCGPTDYRVGGKSEAPGLFGLVVELAGADRALVRVEQVAAQGVEGFAFVELAGYLAPVVRIGQVAGGVYGAAQGPVLLERGGEGVLPAGRGQLADQQRGGGVPELQRPGQPQQVVQCSAIGSRWPAASSAVRRAGTGPRCRGEGRAGRG